MPAPYRPGTYVTTRADVPPRTLPTNTGTWFVVGAAQKGSTTSAKLIRSMQEFATFFGSRQAYSLLWDSLELFFREGGVQAYVARVSGPSSVVASRTLADASAGSSLVVSAKNVGAWGNSLSVQTTQPATGQFQLTVFNNGVQVDRSPVCNTQQDAISWSRVSNWVAMTLPVGASTLIPAVAAAGALTGGADDVAGITDSIRQAALNLFTPDLGPGQVSVPGSTSSGVRAALIAHETLLGRNAILDNTDTSSASAALSEAQSLQAPGNEYGSLAGPWVVIPGLIPGTTRTVPVSAFVAGLMARSDAVRSVNVPAMANNGFARFAIDVTQPGWTDAERDSLNSAGLNVVRATSQGVQLYGYRTLASPNIDPTWLNLGNQRLRNVISFQADRIAQGFVGAQLDGKGRTIAEFSGRLKAMLVQHYTDGALYGATVNGAFRVDVGPSVNTAETLANNELHAVIGLRMSPFAELVYIEIVKVGVNATL